MTPEFRFQRFRVGYVQTGRVVGDDTRIPISTIPGGIWAETDTESESGVANGFPGALRTPRAFFGL